MSAVCAHPTDMSLYTCTADAQKALYIPPSGIPFRLCGLGSKKVLYSSKTGSPKFGQVAATELPASAHWFKLVYGTDKKKDLYEIKSVETGSFFSLTSSGAGMLDKEGTDGQT